MEHITMQHVSSPTVESDLLTVSQVARLLGIAAGTLRGHADRGLIPCLRVGGHRVFQRAAVEAALERSTR